MEKIKKNRFFIRVLSSNFDKIRQNHKNLQNIFLVKLHNIFNIISLRLKS